MRLGMALLIGLFLVTGCTTKPKYRTLNLFAELIDVPGSRSFCYRKDVRCQKEGEQCSNLRHYAQGATKTKMRGTCEPTTFCVVLRETPYTEHWGTCVKDRQIEGVLK
jgi:hypothetical protein